METTRQTSVALLPPYGIAFVSLAKAGMLITSSALSNRTSNPQIRSFTSTWSSALMPPIAKALVFLGSHRKQIY